jgi:MarR family transcriptional regulator for hemolysin
MAAPPRSPIGLQLARASKVVSGAFDDALAAAGGSLPVWLVLLSLKTRQPDNQRELAEAVGIQEATLTHHLNAMAAQGLLTRERDPANRRVHQVRLTGRGEDVFLRLRTAAVEFDRRLRGGIPDGELEELDRILQRLSANVSEQANDTEQGGAAGLPR